MDNPIALTAGGSDSCGGAGIQADLRTFARLKVYGLSVITAVTAQNTVGVLGVYNVADEFVTRQLDAVLEDALPAAMKTGMLASAATVEAVAASICRYGIQRVVVDPVLVSTSGTPLLPSEDVETLRHSLFPLAMIVTPNLAEAEILTGRPVGNIREMEEAARRLHGMGVEHVLVKGGHLLEEPVDVFFDGAEFTHFRTSRVATDSPRGTGCVLSAAIAAHLAHGREIHEAVRLAKEFITEAILNSRTVGRGAPILLG